jgi:hypothetical protein
MVTQTIEEVERLLELEAVRVGKSCLSPRVHADGFWGEVVELQGSAGGDARRETSGATSGRTSRQAARAPEGGDTSLRGDRDCSPPLTGGRSAGLRLLLLDARAVQDVPPGSNARSAAQ